MPQGALDRIVMKESEFSDPSKSSHITSEGSLSMSPPGFALSASGSASPSGNNGVVQRQADSDGGGGESATTDAKDLYDAMKGLGTNEAKIFRALEGRAAAHLRSVMTIFEGYGEGTLESWLKSELGGQDYKRAMTALWPGLSVYRRMVLQEGWLDDNEEAMVEVIVTASAAEQQAAAADSRVQTYVEAELGIEDQLKVAKLLWADQLYNYTVKFIRQADGWFFDDEGTVIAYLLDLSQADRRRMWEENRSLFRMFAGYKATDTQVNPDSAFGKVRKVCLGTEAEALEGAMSYATTGWGTDDELVAKVVTETGAAVQQEQELSGLLERGELSEEQEAEAKAELDGLGGVQENLLEVDDAATEFESGSFLDMLRDDVGADQFEAFAAQVGMDDFDRAKRMILEAVGLWDDEEKIYRAIESVENQDVRDRLMADEDIRTALTHLNSEENAVAEGYASDNAYVKTVHKIEQTNSWLGRDFGEFFTLFAGMSDADQQRFVEEHRNVIVGMQVFGSETVKAAINEILETGQLSTTTAMEFATIGAGTADDFLTTTLQNMGAEERMMYRVGYAISRGHEIPDALLEDLPFSKETAESEFNSLYAMLEGDLSHDDLQKALDDLVSAPTLPEYSTEGGLELISFILNQRVVEKGATRDGGGADGFVDLFTNTGGTADVAEVAARSQYAHMTADGEVTEAETFELGRLGEEFGDRHEDYVAAVDTVADMASTAAAIAAAVAVTFFTGGAGGPLAGSALAGFLGSTQAAVAVTAAAAGGFAKTGMSELVGGEHNSFTEEGAADFAVGSVEGAMTALTAGLAQSFHKSFGSLVGLRGTALSAEMTVGTLRAASSSLSGVGKQFAQGAIRGAIDGVISGAVGELVVAAMDEDSYRKSIWDTLVNFGAAIARGAAMGGIGGSLGGGFAEALSFTISKARLPQLLSKLQRGGLGLEELDLLSQAQARTLGAVDNLVEGGRRNQAKQLFSQLAADLDPDLAARLRRSFFEFGDMDEARTFFQSRYAELMDPAYMSDFVSKNKPMEARYQVVFERFNAAMQKGDLDELLLLADHLEVMDMARKLKNALLDGATSGKSKVKRFLWGKNVAYGRVDLTLPDGSSIQENIVSIASDESTLAKLPATVEVDGITYRVVGDPSNFNDIPGMLRETMSSQKFDSELKFYNYLLHRIQEESGRPLAEGDELLDQVSGSVSLSSEMSPCSSCTNVMNEQVPGVFGENVTTPGVNGTGPEVGYGVDYNH